MNVYFAKARVLASEFVNRVLIGKFSGRLPKNSIYSLEEAMWLSVVSNHVSKVTTINNPCIVEYDFPKSYPPQFRRCKSFDRTVLYELVDAYVSPTSGLVWLPESYLLSESVGSLNRVMGWGGVLHEPLLKASVLECNEPIVACPPTGYYHWLLEVMPNILHAFSICPNLKILLSAKSPQYLLGALRLLLGADAYEKKLLSSQGPVRVSKLTMYQAEPYSGFIHPGNLERLRATIRPKGIRGDSSRNKLIYVSRRLNPKRKLENEDELAEKLLALGFDIVHCEDISFEEQINLFSMARLIVAPHGAGLSNMVWAQPPCKVVEIFPCSTFNDCYARLAVTLGFEYDYVMSDMDSSGRSNIPVEIVLEKLADIDSSNTS